MSSHEEMHVWLRKDETTQLHFHPETELDFVVDGRACVTIKDTHYHLEHDQFILLNAGILHRIYCEEPDTILLCVKFSARSMAELSKEENNVFYCNSVECSDEKHQKLRRIIHELVYYQVQKPHKTEAMRRSILYKILDCLMEEFRLEGGRMQGPANEDDLKLMQIYAYVNQNFRDSISLTDLANELYISKSTLSRFFKKQTGIYFSDYVNQVRLQAAVEDLIYSDKNVTKIASDNGFSTPSAMNKIFQEAYAMTPSQFREKEGHKSREQTPEAEVVLSEDVRQQLRQKLELTDDEEGRDEIAVSADMTQAVQFPKKWGWCINVGSASDLMVANLQYHTLYLKEHLGYTHVRIWSIFSRKLMISDGKTRKYYNYNQIDTVLDFLVSNQLTPFLDFGNRPDTAVFAPGVPVYNEDEYIPFASKGIWQDLLKDFILHITNRYGERHASKWIFEFSRGFSTVLDGAYYLDENFSYFEAFAYGYQTIKHYLPDAQVGGPMAEMEKDYTFTKDFLKSCLTHGCIPDFVSFMLFPYHSDDQKMGPYTEKAILRNAEPHRIDRMKELLDAPELAGCKLYITEWNNTLSNRNFLNDGCFRAAYMCKTIADIADQVDLLAVWMASDWVSSYYDTVRIANGGSGLLTKDSIRKPAYFALQFLGQMGTGLVAKGPGYIITKSENGDFYILCFHFIWFGMNYFLQEGAVADPGRIPELFDEEQVLRMDFCLENIEGDAEYIIRFRSISEENGSILTQWKHFQYDRNLRSADIKYIRDCCFPRMRMEHVQAENGQLHIHTSLMPQEVSLLHIYKD